MNKPQLQRYDEFAKLLSTYHISDAGKALLAELDLVLVVSITSAGKNSIVKKLVETDKYEYVVSHTTRPKRTHADGSMEQDGVEYFFRTEDDMYADLEAGKFLEAEIIHERQVSGVHLDELEKAKKDGKIALDEINIMGAHTVHAAKPDAHFFFILPPSYKEWMERLKNRGGMSQDEYLDRLRSAEIEIEAAINNDFYTLIINDDLDDAVAAIRGIVEEGAQPPHDGIEATDVAWRLLNEIKSQLRS